MKVLKKKLEEPSNLLSGGRFDNYNINYSGKFTKILWNYNSESNSSPDFLDEGKKESVQAYIAFNLIQYQH